MITNLDTNMITNLDTLYDDLINKIVDNLPMPDIRSLFRCNKILNKNNITIYEKQFGQILIDNHVLESSIFSDSIKIKDYNTKSIDQLSLCDKYTIEYLFYGYAKQLHKRYYCKNNIFLHRSANLYIYYGQAMDIIMIKKISMYIQKNNLNFNKHQIRYIGIGASFAGNIDVLKWAKSKLLEWPEHPWDICITFPYIGYYAAINSKQEVLDMLITGKTYGDNADWFAYYIYQGAIDTDNVQLMDWIYSLTQHHEMYRVTLYNAIKNGYLDIIKWICQKGFLAISHNPYPTAIKYNQLEIIDCIYKNGIAGTWDSVVNTKIAIEYDRFDILKWIYQQGILDMVNFCTESASRGKVDFLKWAQIIGLPWNDCMVSRAVNNCQLETLIWLIRNNAPVHPHLAYLYNEIDKLEAAYNNGMRLIRRRGKNYKLGFK